MIALADMLAHHKSELICDLAEYYHIYDHRRVPCRLLGTLAVGLRAESRIGMIREGIKASPETIMLVRLHDILMREFSAKGKEPEPLLKQFVIENKESAVRTFRNGDAFMRKWADINRRKQ